MGIFHFKGLKANFKDGNVQIITLPLKTLSDQVWIDIYKVVISVCLSVCLFVCFSDHNSGTPGPICLVLRF